MFKLIILIVSIGFSFSNDLTYEENRQRLENCGKEPKFDSYHFELTDKYNKKDNGFAISPRHLLFPTAPLFLLNNKKWYRGIVSYDPSTQCTNGIMKMDNPIGCTINGKNVTVEKMVFIGTDCNENNYPRGIVVLEFSSSSWNPPYICLSGNSLPGSSNVTVLDTNPIPTTRSDTTAPCSTQNDTCTSTHNPDMKGVAENMKGIWNLIGTVYKKSDTDYSFIDWKTFETQLYNHTGISNVPYTTIAPPTTETVTSSVLPSTIEVKERTEKPLTYKELMNQKCPKGYECYMINILDIIFPDEVSSSSGLNFFIFFFVFFLFY